LLDFARLGALAIAVFVSLLVIAIGSLQLGLDLRGGARLEYTLAPDAWGEPLTEDAIPRAREVIARRLDSIDLAASVIARDTAILVELVGDAPESLDAARDVLAVGGRLALLEVDDTWPGPSALPDAGVSLEREDVLNGSVHFLGARGPDARARLLAFIAREPLPTRDHALLVGPWDDGTRTYLVVRTGGIDGSHLIDADVTHDYDQAQIMVRFDAEGARALEALTERLTRRRLAIVLDDVVVSAPIVMEPIGGGRASITVGADATEDATQALAAALRSGALPAPLVLERESLIGASISMERRVGAAAAFLALWLILSAAALMRFRARGLAAALAVPLTSIVALAIYGVMLDGTLTAASIVGLALGALLSACFSAAVLEGAARAWQPTPWAVLAATGVLCVVAFATQATGGPTGALSGALGCALAAAAFVSLTFAPSVAAHTPT
jgi:preprotein translocase subunit SecD